MSILDNINPVNSFENFSGFMTDPTGSGAAGKAAEQQQAAQDKALNLQQGLYATGNQQINSAADNSRNDLASNTQIGLNALGGAYGQQQGYYGQAGQALQQGQQGSLGALSSGYGGASSALQLGYGQARNDLAGVDTSTALGANFEQDPGYQFRLQQGQQALDRQQAASGGRSSGAALKALSQYNQVFASNEYGQAAQRDAQLRQMQMQQGANLGNLAMGYGQQQSGLASNYGQQQAGIYGNTAGSMANLYGNQAGAAQNYGQGQASMYGNLGNSLAGTYNTQMAAQLGQNQLLGQAYSNYAGFGGAGQQNIANQNAATSSGLMSVVGAILK